MDEELRSTVPRRFVSERLVEAAENVSLKDVALEDRRKEAGKPLFLIRYE